MNFYFYQNGEKYNIVQNEDYLNIQQKDNQKIDGLFIDENKNLHKRRNKLIEIKNMYNELKFDLNVSYVSYVYFVEDNVCVIPTNKLTLTLNDETYLVDLYTLMDEHNMKLITPKDLKTYVISCKQDSILTAMLLMKYDAVKYVEPDVKIILV